MLESIKPDEPAGTDISFDSDFENLEGEIRKLESVSGGVVEWPLVTSLGQSILREKSKDFRAAAYLVLGLYQTEGLEGLRDGLDLYRGLTEQYWENGFPAVKRIRVRQNAVKFMVEKLEEFLGLADFPDPGFASECVESVNSLEDRLKAVLEDKTPSLSPLRQILENLAQGSIKPESSAPAPEKPSPPEADQGKEEAAPQEAEYKGDKAEVVSPVNPPKQKASAGQSAPPERELTDISQKIKKTAWRIKKDSPKSETPYRLLRTAAWMNVTGPPPNQNGLTMLPAPPKNLVNALDNLMESGNWRDLTDRAEENVTQYLFWLDLHYLSHLGLKHLGPEFEPARSAVELSTFAFYKRIPELADLKFEDGRPFVSQPAMDWLEQASSSKKMETFAPVHASGDEFTAQMADLIKEAHDLTRKGDLRQAMFRLQQARDQAPAGRSRFLCQLKMSQFCLEIGRSDLAVPQLKGLEEMILHFSLEQWDPNLCADVYRDLYLIEKAKLRETPSPTTEQKQALEDIFSRLARVDAAAAVDVRKTPER